MDACLTPDQKKKLLDIFGSENCLFSREELNVYKTDASRIQGDVLALVRPVEESQIVELMRLASAENIPVYPRARATNTAGGCTPTRPGIVLSMLKMNKIIEIDENDFVVVTQPGVVTKDLQEAVAAKKLMYPPDPASFDMCTIGGNIATCAGGMSAVKYGVTRDYLLATRVVLPDGTIAEFGARTHKNVVGLDVNRLLCGSEGTLGVITKMTLKLIPLPQSSASVLLGFDSLKKAMDCVASVFSTGILPCALEFIGEKCLGPIAELGYDIFPENVTTCLLIKLDDSIDVLPIEIERLMKVVKQQQPVFMREGISREDEDTLWEVRRLINAGSVLVAPNKIADDVTVPRSRLYEALCGIEEVGQKFDLTILTFGHVGDGNIHVNIMFDAGTQQDIATQAKYAINKLVISLGGVLSGEHGIGLSKAKTFSLQIGKTEQGIMRRIKTVFDPQNILNPDKAY